MGHIWLVERADLCCRTCSSEGCVSRAWAWERWQLEEEAEKCIVLSMSWAQPLSLQHGPGGMRKRKQEWKRYRKSGWKVKECHRRRRWRWEGIRGFGRAMGLSSWRVDRLGSDSSMCISDPCPLSVHTHSSPYSNSGIHKHFPTGKIKAPIRGHFVASLCLLWGLWVKRAAG